MTHHHPQGETVHTVSYGRFVLVWLGLVALTTITVAVSGIDLKAWTVVIALSIASTKMLLVLNVFMYLGSEERMFRLFLLVAGVILLIFFTLTFFDYAFHG